MDKELNFRRLEKRWDNISDMIVEHSPKLLLALAIIIIGFWFVGKLMKIITATLKKSGIGDDVTPYLTSILGALLKVMLVFSAASLVGVETSSFVAMLAAAGFAVGLALQGSLSNFAAGILILVFKPFKVGDNVLVDGVEGNIKEIQIFNTIIAQYNNKIAIVPNSDAINKTVHNFSREDTIRVDIPVAMPYEASFDEVKKVILEGINQMPKVLKSPAAEVHIDSFDTHFVQLTVWPFAKSEDYWEVYYEAHEVIKSSLGAAGMKMAYSEGVELGKIAK